MAAMAGDWLRQRASAPPEALLDRKAQDYRALVERLTTALGDARIGALREAAATATAAGQFAEADKALAQAELHAIGNATDLSALPLERRLLIGENRADRAALSFLRTAPEAYREAASRFGEASALIGLADIGRSRAAALEQANVLARSSEDFGGREGYEAAVGALRRLLVGLDRAGDTGALIATHEAAAAALEALAEMEGDAKLRHEALVHSRAALEHLRHEDAPTLWRAAKLRLGRLAVSLGISGRNDDLLEEAISAYATVLHVWPRGDDEARWLEAEHMISRARATLGKRRIDLSLLERAFNGLNRVSEAIDRAREPLRWAELQDQMGGVLRSMGERYKEPVVIEEAIAAYDAALEERRQDKVPLLWALSRANQAEAILQLAMRVKNKALAQQALTQLMEAVETSRRTAEASALTTELQKRLAAAGAQASRLLVD